MNASWIKGWPVSGEKSDGLVFPAISVYILSCLIFFENEMNFHFRLIQMGNQAFTNSHARLMHIKHL